MNDSKTPNLSHTVTSFVFRYLASWVLVLRVVDTISCAVKIFINRYAVPEPCFDAARHDLFLGAEAVGSK